MSPDFLYRFDLAKTAAAPKAGLTKAALTKPFIAEPLTGYNLASRLSYFLWSSQPDAELRQIADAGQLRARPLPRSRQQR